MENSVSIIIPVFNADQNLKDCINSLLNQTYKNLEILFINDCSIDNSIQIIESFKEALLEKYGRVQVLSHSYNKGVAAARNTGLDNATGDYIYYVDADDYIDHDAIEQLVNEAIKENADIVGCNWNLTFSKNERTMNQPHFTSPLEAIEKMLYGVMRWNLWMFLVKRDLYTKNEIQFIPGQNIGEDMLVMFKLFVNAQKVCFLNKALYHYRQDNASSLTKTQSDTHLQQVTFNVSEVEKYLLKSKYREEIEGLINFFKLNIKLPMLISNNSENYKAWLNWFPEANVSINMNPLSSLRTKFIQNAAAKRQFWLLKLYYYCIIRFVYGIVYK